MAKGSTAGKAMTKSQTAAHLAEDVGISKKQATQFMQSLSNWPTSRPRTASPSRASGSSFS